MTQKITGYRSLSEEEIALMNEGKELGILLGTYIDKLLVTPGIELRFLNIGKTNLQQGLMAVARSIAKPTTF